MRLLDAWGAMYKQVEVFCRGAAQGMKVGNESAEHFWVYFFSTRGSTHLRPIIRLIEKKHCRRGNIDRDCMELPLQKSRGVPPNGFLRGTEMVNRRTLTPPSYSGKRWRKPPSGPQHGEVFQVGLDSSDRVA